MKRALKINGVLKDLNYCQWFDTQDIQAIELPSGEEALVFYIDSESG